MGSMSKDEVNVFLFDEVKFLKATLVQMREAIEKLLPKVSCDSIACQPRCLCGAEKISESGRKLLSQTQDIAAQQEAKLLRAEIKGIENCPVASWDKQTMITELSKQADRLEEKK